MPPPRLFRLCPFLQPHQRRLKSTTTTTTAFDPQAYLDSALRKFRSTPPRRIPAILTPDRSVRLTQALHHPASHTSPPPPSTLPPGHHMVYFEPLLTPQETMSDGTDVNHWPGPPFQRRMWAGGSVTFFYNENDDGSSSIMKLDGKTEMVCVESIKSDDDASDVTIRINEGDQEKDKVFVELEREYFVVVQAEAEGSSASSAALSSSPSKRKVIEERRKLVFMRERAASSLSSSSSSSLSSSVRRDGGSVIAPWKPDFKFPLVPTADLLATFSQLTNNAHLIHLDREYAQKQEGYKDVLVQGPLTLVLMLEALSKVAAGEHEQGCRRGYVKEIEYRNLSPLFKDEELNVCLKRNKKAGGAEGKEEGQDRTWIVWIEGPGGRLAVKGRGVTTSTAKP